MTAAASTPAVGCTGTPEQGFKMCLPVFAVVSEKWILWLALSHHFCTRRLHATSVSPSKCAESRKEESANCVGSSADYKYHDAPVSLRQTGGEPEHGSAAAWFETSLIRWRRWKPKFHSCWGIGLHVRGGELVSTATSDEGWGMEETWVIKWEVNKDAEGLVMMTRTCPWGSPSSLFYIFGSFWDWDYFNPEFWFSLLWLLSLNPTILLFFVFLIRRSLNSSSKM